MSNYDGKIELPQMYNMQGEEQYLSSDKSDTYLWLAEENTKQAKQIERLQEQLKEAVDFIEELSDACDLEGILYPQQRKKLEEIEKWGVK